MTTSTTPSTTTLLLEGATVVTVDPQLGTLTYADVLVRDGVIAAVGPDLAARPDLDTHGIERVDARGTIAVPGFVDAHVHAWEGILRGLAPTADFAQYLGLTAFGLGPHLRPADVYAGTTATAFAALDVGITTVVDNAHGTLTPDHAVAGAEAWQDAGVRAVYAVGSPFGAALEHIPHTAVALRERFAGDRFDVRLFDIDPTEELWRFAEDHDLWVSSEFGPHTGGLTERVESLHAAGLLTPRHALNHCYDLPTRVWELVGDSGAVVNLCARSDAQYGLGSTVPPVADALRHAAAIGLSNDNETSYSLSMFAEMQNLLLRDRAEQFRLAAIEGHPRPEQLTPEQVLAFATRGGAANAGLADRVGTLTPGKQADIVLLRSDGLAALSAAAPETSVVHAHPGQVDAVFVAGRARKWAGRLVNVDRDAVADLVEASRDAVRTAAAGASLVS